MLATGMLRSKLMGLVAIESMFISVITHHQRLKFSRNQET